MSESGITFISFSATDFSSPEGNSGSFVNTNVVTLNRTGNLSETQTVQVLVNSISPGSAVGGDSISELTDYNNTSFPITVTFNPGEETKTVEIPIYGDTTVEASDTIGLELINPSEGVSLGISTATLTIQNDDSRGLLDIVFVQDLSGSFGDDIATVRGLIPGLIANILSFEPSAQFAVASFVDKPISPFGFSWTGDGDYVYRTDLPLTANVTDVQSTYNNLVILAGGDYPESQLEALMQTGLRTGELGFRPDSQRLAIIFTDAPYHVAGDGASAGIYTPNNGDDILDGTPAGTGEDYPGIAQVASILSAAGVRIVPVFAVTPENISAYENLISQLGGGGSVVSLANDSSNIASAVQAALGNVVNINVDAAPNLLTTEAGGTATFTVSLTSQPTADVIIPISSSDPTEGEVSVTSLVFTPTNFNVPQTITVTGVNDDLNDGDVSYLIVTGEAISEDPNYNGRNAGNVAITNVNDDKSEKYNFTYFYGNGDSYSGYVYAPSGTYSVGQLPDYYDNETGSQQGYYVIDSVEDGENGTYGYVSVTSYTDADTGFGTTTNLYSGVGYSGLGSEQGYAFNANPWTGDYYFSRYYEADLPAVLQVRLNLLADNDGTPGAILANNQIGLNHSFFVQIQVGDFRGNAAGVVGLNLDFAWDGLTLESINFDPTLAIDPKFSFFQEGTLYDGFIDDLSGGSLPEFELGQAIGVNQLDTFALLHFSTQGYGTTYFTTTVNDASLADDNPYYSLDVETSQSIEVVTPYTKYSFTYYYGNGDSYTGYVYAAEGTYTEDQVLEGYANNETGNLGYYQIGSIIGTTLDSWYNNQVYITSYTDLDTGFDTTTNIGDVNWWDGIHGYSGLGSEYAYAYDVNGNSSDPLFGAYPDGSGIHKEADIINQKYTFTYTYGNGDSYSGYGYALAGTYTEGQVLSGYLNETNPSPGGTGAVENDTLGSSMDSVYHFSYTFTNLSDALTLNFIGSGLQDISDESWGLDNVKVTAGAFNYSNDFESDSVTGWSRSTRSTTPAGSRNFLGEFSNDTVSLELNDVALNGSVTVEFDLFIINTWDGIGNLGAGADKFTVNTSGGETLLNTTFAKFPGQLQSYPYSLPGYYTINSVEASTTSSSENNRVYVTSYFDGDTGYGETTNVYSYGGNSGLGSEYGSAYTSNWSSYDALFGADGSGIHKEADLVIASLSISDNSGNANDSSIKFTTQFPSSRTNYTESDLVRPNFADTTKYFDITNNGSGILQVSDIVSNVAGVTTNFVDDLLINPGQSQRIQLTYDPSAAGENFSVSNGLVLFTNDPYNPQYAIALSGKSTFNSDINYDGRVGTGDLGALNNALKNFKNGIYDGTADINGDSLINNADLTVFSSERNLSLV